MEEKPEELYTLNGLATKMRRDRRTVTDAMRGVPPDGKVGRYDAWSLSTAAIKLNQAAGHRYADHRRSERFSDILLERLDCWPEIYGEPSKQKDMSFDFEVAAALFGISPDGLLNCLRAGMPYAKRGDFANGDGFRISIAWSSEWMIFTGKRLRDDGAVGVIEQLGLQKYAYP